MRPALHYRSLSLLAVAGLAACAPQAARDAPQAARPVPGPVPIETVAGLEGVMGRTQAQVTAQFGRPALDIREGTARKLQFESPVCILDAYFYPAQQGREPVVTYLDARTVDGRDIDRATCVAALVAQRQVR
jgi:hypothetical protein